MKSSGFIINSIKNNFVGWLTALCNHTFLRRAADDMVLALRSPTEAFIYLYRAFEWLEDGLKISKKEMAAGIGVQLKDFKELGKMANNMDFAVRHASKTGVKTRANFETYSTWMCGLVDGVNYARQKLDKQFKPMGPKEVADLVHISVSYTYR
jgi:hypothetical protein